MTAFVLKIIALTCMLIDHVGAVFPMYFPMAFRVIGRVSFPIYVYLIADGCRYTRSMPKYLSRLGIFALLSQIPFDLAFNQAYDSTLHISFLYDTNVFYTLFLGALSIYAYQRLRAFSRAYTSPLQNALPLLTLLPLIVLMGLAEWMQTDYGGFGVAFIFFMYAVPKKIPRLCLMALCCAYEFYQVLLGTLAWVCRWGFEAGLPISGVSDQLIQRYLPYANTTGWWMLAACWASVPLVALYKGRRGPSMKWFFYAAYPAHLLLLGCIWLFWVRPALLR